jgi:outer membrane protein OmpA-like peptidoglycan-associated protein/tetratricopeptide (TPR) repeat protein
MMKYLFLIFFIFSLLPSLQAQQEFTTDNKRAVKYFKEGLAGYQRGDFKVALEKMSKALEKDDQFVEAYIIKAQVYEHTGKSQLALENYQKVMEINPDFFPNVFLSMGLIYFQQGNYKKSKEYLDRFIAREDITLKLKKKAREIKRSCLFAIRQKDNPVSFRPENLGDSINSQFSEYWPSISADGKTLVFTRLIPRNDLAEIEQRLDEMNERQRAFMESVISKKQEDFFVSNKRDSIWKQAVSIGSPINTEHNEGAQSLSSDGNEMYFSACNKDDGKGSCDIYYSKKQNGQWSKPENIGAPVNTSSWESQPSISPDGQVLYFASNRKGGEGKKDIWMSRKKEDGSWSEPKNLGDSVNTPETEMAPFIHMDNQTLYFSSDGHLGMGGMDLYKTSRKDENSWTVPENLGFPINTHKDEFGLIVEAQGKNAYYVSNRRSDRKRDIYTFVLPEKSRPTPSSYMEGLVYDAETKKPLKAEFELLTLDSGKMIMNAYSDQKTGNFLVCLPVNNDYVLNVSRKGYLFYSDNFSFKGTHEITQPFQKDIPLKPIKEGERIVLRNIFFETDSFRLKAESKVELNKLYQFLQENPKLRIEISGHTDSVGTDLYNEELSDKRARSVYYYLTKKGISKKRLEYKGYGESQPIAPNSNAEGRARNRRTEIKVLGNQ